jgi:hypothetical protein
MGGRAGPRDGAPSRSRLSFSGDNQRALLPPSRRFQIFRTIRSGQFGPIPDEPYRVDLTQSYCNTGGTCGGTFYRAAF